MRPLHPAERIAEWTALAAAGNFAPLAEELMSRHYDPRYARHRARMAEPLAQIEAGGLTPADLPALADRLAAAVQALR